MASEEKASIGTKGRLRGHIPCGTSVKTRFDCSLLSDAPFEHSGLSLGDTRLETRRKSERKVSTRPARAAFCEADICLGQSRYGGGAQFRGHLDLCRRSQGCESLRPLSETFGAAQTFGARELRFKQLFARLCFGPQGPFARALESDRRKGRCQRAEDK